MGLCYSFGPDFFSDSGEFKTNTKERHFCSNSSPRSSSFLKSSPLSLVLFYFYKTYSFMSRYVFFDDYDACCSHSPYITAQSLQDRKSFNLLLHLRHSD